MKIFMTGGTGYIGKAVAAALKDQGYLVRTLVRSESSAEEARNQGMEPVTGDLQNPQSFLEEIRAADAVIHLANTGDSDAGEVDEKATKTMVQALEGTGKPFLYTSGVWVLGATSDGELHEDSPVDPAPMVSWRGPLERWLKDKASADVRTVIIRPGIVFGEGGGIPGMIGRGELPLVGDGTQRWPMVHLKDLADLYRKALEAAPPGSVLHGVTTVAPAQRIAEFASPSGYESVPVEEARKAMGPFADALALDQNVTSRKTQKELGWYPDVGLTTPDKGVQEW